MDAAQIHALKDGPGEGRGRRARARRSPVRREQQKEGDKESLATASIRKKYNLSIEQKQRIIDSLNVARNDFLSRWLLLLNNFLGFVKQMIVSSIFETT